MSMSANCSGDNWGLWAVWIAKDYEKGFQDAFLRFHRPV